MNPITQSDTMRFFALGWSGDRIKPESVIGMARIRNHDGSSLLVTYNGMGNRLSEVDSRGATSYDYDARNRLVRRADPDGQTLDYVYTVTNRLASVTTSGGRTTSHSYDALV